jgi:hypothetical protein
LEEACLGGRERFWGGIFKAEMVWIRRCVISSENVQRLTFQYCLNEHGRNEAYLERYQNRTTSPEDLNGGVSVKRASRKGGRNRT